MASSVSRFAWRNEPAAAPAELRVRALTFSALDIPGAGGGAWLVCTGVDALGRTVCLREPGFKSELLVAVEDDQEYTDVIEKIAAFLEAANIEAPERVLIERARPYECFCGDKTRQHVRLFFGSVTGHARAKKILAEHFDVLNAKISPLQVVLARRRLTPTSNVCAHAASTSSSARKSQCAIEAVVVDTIRIDEAAAPAAPAALVLNFDIEALGNTEDGETLFPNATEPSNAITVICSEVFLLNKPAQIERAVFSWRPLAHITGADLVFACDDERAMLLAFSEYVRALLPDFVGGYNVLGFDLKYVHTRCARHNVRIDRWAKMPFDGYGGAARSPPRLLEKTSKIGTPISYWDVFGCVIFDALPLVRKSYNLDSYKLGEVGAHFLGGETKVDLSVEKMFAYAEGTPEQVAILATYCLQDVALVTKLCLTLKLLANLVAEAEVTRCSLQDLVIKAQGARVFGCVAEIIVRENWTLSSLRQRYNEKTSAKYEGAIVLDPVVGVHSDPVVLLDFASLYPSTIMANNLDLASLCTTDERPEQYTFSTIGAHTFCLDAPSIIPGVMRRLKQERAAIRATKKKNDAQALALPAESAERAELEQISDVLEALQLQTKILANSLYGTLGFADGVLPAIPVAQATCAWGREYIMSTKKYVEDNTPYTVIYGDTDSVFVELTGCREPAEAARIGKDLAERCTHHINSLEVTPLLADRQVLQLEFDDLLMGNTVLYGKKTYVAQPWEFVRGAWQRCSKLMIKGLPVKRRDTIRYSRAAILRALIAGVHAESAAAASEAVAQSVLEALQGFEDASIENLVVSKQIARKYAGTPPAHAVLARRCTERGDPRRAGERMPFVFIVPTNKNAQQSERVEEPEFAAKHKLKIDFLYYFQHQLKEPILRLCTPFCAQVPEIVAAHERTLTNRQNGQREMTSFFKRAKTSPTSGARLSINELVEIADELAGESGGDEDDVGGFEL
jgi:DNA polymerase delta subunit 1